MRKIIFIILLIFTTNLFAQKAKDSLNIKKTELEIQKLENDLNSSNLFNELKIAAAFIAALGLFWTLISGFHTLKIQNATLRNNKIATALELLTSEKANNRYSGSVIMSRYINEAIEECIGVLAFENNYKIKRALINVSLRPCASCVGQKT